MPQALLAQGAAASAVQTSDYKDRTQHGSGGIRTMGDPGRRVCV